MESEKNKITRQIGISLAIIGILFLAIVTLNLSKNEEIIIFCFMYGFMVFMVFNLFKISKAGDVDITNTINTLNKLKLKTTGEFKRTFTVNGLNEKAKEKETIIVKEGSSNSSSERSHSISGRTAYVKPSVGVNLRSDKNDTSRIITSIKGGAAVTIRSLETNSDGESWAYVDYGSYTGYIRGDLIGG